MKAVIDASVVIHWLRTGDDFLMEKLDGVVSTVTVAELFSGASAQRDGRQRDNLEIILKSWVQVAPNTEIAVLVGELKYTYRLSLGDAFVVALAMDLGLPIATLDKKDFGKIKGLEFYGVDKKRG